MSFCSISMQHRAVGTGAVSFCRNFAKVACLQRKMKFSIKIQDFCHHSCPPPLAVKFQQSCNDSLDFPKTLYGGYLSFNVNLSINKLGWSIEASTLEKPRPQPRISRVFEAEGQIFLHFRGPIEAEGS